MYVAILWKFIMTIDVKFSYLTTQNSHKYLLMNVKELILA